MSHWIALCSIDIDTDHSTGYTKGSHQANQYVSVFTFFKSFFTCLLAFRARGNYNCQSPDFPIPASPTKKLFVVRLEKGGLSKHILHWMSLWMKCHQNWYVTQCLCWKYIQLWQLWQCLSNDSSEGGCSDGDISDNNESSQIFVMRVWFLCCKYRQSWQTTKPVQLYRGPQL